REDVRRIRRRGTLPAPQGIPRLLFAERHGHRGPDHRENEVDGSCVERHRRAVFRGIPRCDGPTPLHGGRRVRLRDGLYRRDRGTNPRPHRERTRLRRRGQERVLRHDDLLGVGQAQRAKGRGTPTGCPGRDRGAKAASRGFVLWRAQKPGEPAWDSPWGKGRPGWHIEDTAITIRHFGPQYDLHGGATELLFPHHEAEIAQAESYTGVAPFVKYWMHGGMVMVSGEEMHKSLGNFWPVTAALQ